MNPTSKCCNFLIPAYAKINLSLDYILILFHIVACHRKCMLLSGMISCFSSEWGNYCFWNKQYIQYVSLICLIKICCKEWVVFFYFFLFWCLLPCLKYLSKWHKWMKSHLLKFLRISILSFLFLHFSEIAKIHYRKDYTFIVYWLTQPINNTFSFFVRTQCICALQEDVWMEIWILC